MTRTQTRTNSTRAPAPPVSEEGGTSCEFVFYFASPLLREAANQSSAWVFDYHSRLLAYPDPAAWPVGVPRLLSALRVKLLNSPTSAFSPRPKGIMRGTIVPNTNPTDRVSNTPQSQSPESK